MTICSHQGIHTFGGFFLDDKRSIPLRVQLCWPSVKLSKNQLSDPKSLFSKVIVCLGVSESRSSVELIDESLSNVSVLLYIQITLQVDQLNVFRTRFH